MFYSGSLADILRIGQAISLRNLGCIDGIGWYGMSQYIKVNSTISTVLRNTSEYGSLCNFLGVILKNL